MEKFDDEATAKEAIASSPEVTQSVVDTLDEEGVTDIDKTAVKAVSVAPSTEDMRNSRLLSGCIKGIIGAVGGETDNDQLSATQELSTEGFCALSGLDPPKALKIGITLFLLVGSFAPVGVAAYTSWKGVKDDID